jgi:carboxypeptidase C (cathepsin A)
MYKSLTAACLTFCANAATNQYSRGFPPTSDNCVTQTTGRGTYYNSHLTWGLKRDPKNGGCKCAADDAEWGPGNGQDEEWRCHCINKMAYEKMEYAYTDTANREKNNKACGVCTECAAAATTRMQGQWNNDRVRVENQKKDIRAYFDDQIMPFSDVARVRAQRNLRTK